MPITRRQWQVPFPVAVLEVRLARILECHLRSGNSGHLLATSRNTVNGNPGRRSLSHSAMIDNFSHRVQTMASIIEQFDPAHW